MTRRLNLEMAAKIWRSALPKGCNKLVLQCYTHHLNSKEDTRHFGLSWPSISRVALMCGMSERTVQIHLRTLQAAGLLRPRLRTGRTTLYSIHLDSLVPLVFAADTVVLDADGNPVDNYENPAEAVDNSASPGPAASVSAETLQESAPESEENDTKHVEICTLTPNTTFKNEPGTAKPPAPALPVLMMVDGVNPKILADFAAIRKTKRKGPVTETLVTEICEQAAIAGMTLEQALKTCCTRNWARFEAAWLHDSGPRAATPGQASSAPATATATPVKVWAPDTTPIPPAPAALQPEPLTPAAPEVVAAAMATYNAKRAPAPAAAPAMPTGASDITIAPDAPPWAVGIVNKQRTGQYVSRTALDKACAVLKINPAILRRASASASTATAARMH